MQPAHRTSDDGEEQRTATQRAVRNLALFAAAIVVVLVGGLVAGYLYAKSSPERAAGSVVAQFVDDEPDRGDEPPREGEVAPTSGAHDGVPRCGRASDPVRVDDQLATLATGAVVVQFDPGAIDVRDAVFDELAARQDVLVAPNPGLQDPVVATAWTQRMALPAATPELLFAFVTAHRGGGPVAEEPCPTFEGS